MENSDNIVQIWNRRISKNEFKKFLDKYCKNKDYNLNAYINDLITQVEETSRDEYELSSYESNTGKTEIYDIEYYQYEVVKSSYAYRKDVYKKHGSKEYLHYASEAPTKPEEKMSFKKKEEAIEYAKELYNNSNESKEDSNNIFLTIVDVLDYSEDIDTPYIIKSFGLTLEEYEKNKKNI